LYYFRQREWRVIRGIIPGKQATGKAIDERHDPAEKAAMLAACVLSLAAREAPDTGALTGRL
jgi:hypothetical protein